MCVYAYICMYIHMHIYIYTHAYVYIYYIVKHVCGYMHTYIHTHTYIWSEKVKVLVTESCPILCNPMDCRPPGSCVYDSPGKNIGMGCHFLLQGIFLIQGSNSGFLCCRQILYSLSHQGSPFIYLLICKHIFGEGNGTPIQYSCLENPMDGGAW